MSWTLGALLLVLGDLGQHRRHKLHLYPKLTWREVQLPSWSLRTIWHAIGPMISPLSPTSIAYIADMVSRKVRQYDKEAELTLLSFKSYLAWVESLAFSPNIRSQILRCPMGEGTQTNTSPSSCRMWTCEKWRRQLRKHYYYVCSSNH